MHTQTLSESFYSHLQAQSSNGQGCLSVDQLSRHTGSWAAAQSLLDELRDAGRIRYVHIRGEVGYVLEKPSVRQREGYRIRKVGA